MNSDQISSDQISEKIDFRPSVEGDILDKESINAPSLGISQIRNQDYFDARVVLMNSGHNGELKLDIRENRISNPYRGHIPGSFPKSFKVNNSSSELKIRWPRDHYKL